MAVFFPLWLPLPVPCRPGFSAPQQTAVVSGLRDEVFAGVGCVRRHQELPPRWAQPAERGTCRWSNKAAVGNAGRERSRESPATRGGPAVGAEN